jgi:hypothetical protein
MSETEKRRILLPSVRAATDCIAREALAHSGIVDAYRSQNLPVVIDAVWRTCLDELTRVAVVDFSQHGHGKGGA